MESGNTVYDSRDNCNAIIKTETNELVEGCKSTTIPNSVTTIGEEAFSGCRGLTSVTIGNSVASIGKYAFSYCRGLTSVTIGIKIINIGDYAFRSCEKLKTFTCYAKELPTANASVFDWVDLEGAILYVRASTDYNIEPWCSFGTIRRIDESSIPSDINATEANDVKNKDVQYYDLSGRRVTSSQHGLHIVRDRNGKTRKVRF